MNADLFIFAVLSNWWHGGNELLDFSILKLEGKKDEYRIFDLSTSVSESQ